MFQAEGHTKELRGHTSLNTYRICVIVSLKPLFELEKLSGIWYYKALDSFVVRNFGLDIL
jgi:hypothetical protein